MKMKKWIALLLVLSLSLGALTACGQSSSSADAAEPTEESSADATEPTEESSASAAEKTAGETASDVETVIEGREPKNGENFVIAYSCIAYAVAPFTTMMGDYLKSAVEENGWTFDYLAAEGDVELQAEQVTTLISMNPDVLVVYAGDASLTPVYCQEAYDAGIPVILIMCSIDEENRYMTMNYVGTDQYDISYEQAQQMVERYGADSETLIVSVSGVEAQEDYQLKLNGFLDGLKDAGVINEDGSAGTWTFVGPEWCLSSRDTAQSAMENYIATYGDAITAVIGFDDDLTMGCVNAIQEHNLGDSIEVWSQMGMIEMIQAIRDGKAYSTVYMPASENANAVVQVIKDYVAGIEQPEWQVAPNYVVITPDNCYDYDGDF